MELLKPLSLTLFLTACILSLPDQSAAEVGNLGGHQSGGEFQGLKVVEEKCLTCHNRQRIEQAIRQKKDMAAIQGQMEVKGAVLSEREQSVLRHFWKKNPFRGGSGTGIPARKSEPAIR